MDTDGRVRETNNTIFGAFRLRFLSTNAATIFLATSSAQFLRLGHFLVKG